MRYKVLPFQAQISSNGGANDVANQLQSLIAAETAGGWEYMRLETVETYVAGTNGCFGLGATPARMTSYPVAVFRNT
jgi:hypothetical protein